MEYLLPMPKLNTTVHPVSMVVCFGHYVGERPTAPNDFVRSVLL